MLAYVVTVVVVAFAIVTYAVVVLPKGTTAAAMCRTYVYKVCMYMYCLLSEGNKFTLPTCHASYHNDNKSKSTTAKALDDDDDGDFARCVLLMHF